MGAKHKRLAMLVVGLALAYLFTPFVAGLIGAYDRRGPKIFWAEHHELLYTIGYAFTHADKPKVPPRERAWFYGMEGSPLILDKKMQELNDALKAGEAKHTNNY